MYFYPKDDTPGCTRKHAVLRKILARFENQVRLLGVSADSVESHKNFKNKYSLTFPLLSDPNRETIQKYDVWKEKNMYGKKMMGVERTTFVIDEEGKIAHIFPKVKVDGHTEKVLEKLKSIGE